MGREEDSNYYDKIYDTAQIYSEHPDTWKIEKNPIVPTTSFYYALWNFSRENVIEKKPEFIVDLGCGSGQFAAMLAEIQDNFTYRGYDFSSVAIDKATHLVNDPRFSFTTADLRSYNFLKKDYIPSNTVFTAHEFLEHVHFDLEVIEKIPLGCYFSFSVPSFDYSNHVRHFVNYGQVFDRYSPLLDIQRNLVITKSDHDNKKWFVCMGKRI